jgi:hypothetical protein
LRNLSIHTFLNIKKYHIQIYLIYRDQWIGEFEAFRPALPLDSKYLIPEVQVFTIFQVDYLERDLGRLMYFAAAVAAQRISRLLISDADLTTYPV